MIPMSPGTSGRVRAALMAAHRPARGLLHRLARRIRSRRWRGRTRRSNISRSRSSVNIVVTSVSKEPEAVWRTPAAIYVLTHDDIKRSGVTALADALRLVPGVEVAQIDSSRNWVVGIRGFGDQFSKSVLVLIDGRSVYTPLFAGVEWSTQDTLIEDIDRIEVIRGPGGTVWGANAVNGVINIITRIGGRDARRLCPRRRRQRSTCTAIASARFGGAAGGVDYRAYANGFRGRAAVSHRRPRLRPAAPGAGRLPASTGVRATATTVSVHGDLYDGVLGESVRVATFVPAANRLLDGPEDVSGQNLVAPLAARVSAAAPTSWCRPTSIAPIDWAWISARHATPSTSTSSTTSRSAAGTA